MEGSIIVKGESSMNAKLIGFFNSLGIVFLGAGIIYQTQMNNIQIKINSLQGDTTSKLIDRIERLEDKYPKTASHDVEVWGLSKQFGWIKPMPHTED
jgi:hypothetical protein